MAEHTAFTYSLFNTKQNSTSLEVFTRNKFPLYIKTRFRWDLFLGWSCRRKKRTLFFSFT